MSSVCAQQHKFHHSHHLLYSKNFPRDIDSRPRKLLTRRTIQENSEMNSDSPRFSSADETLLQKFLPCNNGVDSDDEHPYSADRFRMYEFKIRRCSRSRSHDWTDCPFAHPGEKARRRDPTFYRYSGTGCPEYRRGECNRGDNCEFAHGVFETWLHPSRYRTEACKDGKNCKRKVCFFAHTPRQLRIVNENCHSPLAEIACKKKKINGCLFCSGGGDGGGPGAAVSPNSILLGMSHLSPPLSPSQSISQPLSPMEGRNRTGISPISRYNERFVGCDSSSLMSPRQGMTSDKEVLTELMSSLVAMKLSEALPVSTVPTNNSPSLPWVDVSFNSDDQQQFILSPCKPPSASWSANSFNGNYSNSKLVDNEINLENGSRACPTPDIEWVNDLLF